MGNLVQDITLTIRKVLDYPLFPSNGITVASLLVLVVLFVIVIVGERFLRRQFVTRLLKRTHLEPAMQFTLARVAGYMILGWASMSVCRWLE
jgi:small-conductance mechanosensitive channel